MLCGSVNIKKGKLSGIEKYIVTKLIMRPMENLEKYKNVFIEAFQINESQLGGLKYQDVDEWDSVGHMGLMTELEEVFDIEMDIDDIIDFSSFEKGIEIMGKYKIDING